MLFKTTSNIHREGVQKVKMSITNEITGGGELPAKGLNDSHQSCGSSHLRLRCCGRQLVAQQNPCMTATGNPSALAWGMPAPQPEFTSPGFAPLGAGVAHVRSPLPPAARSVDRTACLVASAAFVRWSFYLSCNSLRGLGRPNARQGMFPNRSARQSLGAEIGTQPQIKRPSNKTGIPNPSRRILNSGND